MLNTITYRLVVSSAVLKYIAELLDQFFNIIISKTKQNKIILEIVAIHFKLIMVLVWRIVILENISLENYHSYREKIN